MRWFGPLTWPRRAFTTGFLPPGRNGFHAIARGCKPGALRVAVRWRSPRRLHRCCAWFPRPRATVKQAGRLPSAPGKRSARELAGRAGRPRLVVRWIRASMRALTKIPLVVAPGRTAWPLALAPAVDARLVEQVRPVAGPVARHPGDADPPAARAAHPHDGPCPARRPGASFRRPQPLACLVLEADEGAQVARRALISGDTSAFRTATASSSRSIAWRTGTWADQPCRRSASRRPQRCTRHGTACRSAS